MPNRDPNPLDHSFHFEAKKAGLAQTANGTFLRLELNPLDMPPQLWEAAKNQRFMVAITLMPDDMPEPSAREIDEGDQSIRLAGMMCKDAGFQKYLGVAHTENPEKAAAEKLRALLKVESRRELKTNPAARKRLQLEHDRYFAGDL